MEYFWKLMVIVIVSGFSVVAEAQSERPHAREGNKLYSQGKYAQAEEAYRKSLKEKENFFKGTYNLGDALYRQGRYKEAAKYFDLSTGLAEDPQSRAKAYHNLGNAYLKNRKLRKSVEAYKNALKNNPDDRQTKHNLAYAKKLLKKQQKQQKKQQKNQKKKQQKKNQKQKQKQKNNQKSHQQQRKNQKKQEKQNQKKSQKKKQQKPQKPKKEKLSKKEARRLLKALENEELKLQKQKRNEDQKKSRQTEIEKDW